MPHLVVKYGLEGKKEESKYMQFNLHLGRCLEDKVRMLLKVKLLTLEDNFHILISLQIILFLVGRRHMIHLVGLFVLDNSSNMLFYLVL